MYSKKRGIVAIFIIVCALATLLLVVWWLVTKDTTRITQALAKRYGLNEHYILDSFNECKRTGPSSFGEIAGAINCYRVTAVAYYPAIQVSDYVQQPEGLRSVAYVRPGKDAKPITESIAFLVNKGVRPGAPSDLERALALSAGDKLVVSGVSDRYDSKADNRIDGVWEWYSTVDWFGADSPGRQLQDKIYKKIYANTKLAQNAPTTLQALQSGRAPLVVYIIDRYCHNLPFSDDLCIVPG